MTERTITGSQPGPAVGRVSAARAAHGPAVLRLRREPGHLGPLYITQLLVAEVALVAVLVTLTHGVVMVIGAVVGSALLLLVALARHRGRWWLDSRMMVRRYQRRRRDAARPLQGDGRLTALRRLAPGLTVENVTTANGVQVGVARDDGGWYAVAALIPDSQAQGGPSSLPLEKLAAALAKANQPGAVLQVVTQTVPAPSLEAHPSSPTGQSYRQLMSRFGSASVPADRSIWVAVRLDTQALTEAVETSRADLDTAPALVAALVRRVAKSLKHAGFSHRLLDAESLVGTLMNSCDLEPVPHPQQPVQAPQAREEWTEWHSSRLAHRSYWIRSWPPLEQAAVLLDWLTSAPAAMTSVALIVAPDKEAEMVDLRALVRIAAPPAELNNICQSIVQGAGQARAELFQLNGEHGPAVYASAPTGGGAR